MPLFLANAAHPQRLIRSAPSLFPRFILCCALFLGLAHTLQAQTADSVELTLDQARAVAIQALQSGDTGLAIQIARGLLKADPKAALPYYIIATAHAKTGQHKEGRIAAAKAYRFSRPDQDKFRAAQLAAKLAYAEGRPTLTQIWLRRTAIYAPTDEDLERIGKDYKILRQKNPFSFRLNVDVSPSNNVNNGPDTALNIIDGVPDNGTTPPSARALSGFVGTFDLAGGYRLRQNATSETTLTGRLYVRRVVLSNDAKEQAPRATGSDYASTYGEVALFHAFAVGPAGKGGAATLNFALGETWARSDRYYRSARLSGSRSWILADKSLLKLTASGEQRYKAVYSSNDARILDVGATYGTIVGNGNLLSLHAILRDSKAKSQNGTYSSASLRTTYTLKQPVGPALLSLGMVLGYTKYDSYLFTTNLNLGARTRRDKSLYGDVTLTFDDYDYAGFVPTLRLRAGKRSSNFSRFDTREYSISLGIASKF